MFMENLEVTHTPAEVNNLETLLKSLKAERDMPCHNSFLDLHEQEFMDEQTYSSLQFDENGYVANLIDDSL